MARSSLKNVARLIQAAKVSLPPEQEFLADLKRSIEMTEDKNQRKPSQTYKPSGMKCIRAMYYGVTGREQDASQANYTLVGICNSGTDIHERIQKAVSDMIQNNMDCEYIDVSEYVKSRNLDYLDIVSKNGMETKLYHKTLNMSFMCDGIIRYKGHYYILELKTESSFKWTPRQGVNPEHYHQGIAYSVALGIDEVIFVYINRDVLDMKAFMFNVTDSMKQELVGLIEQCDGYVSRQITPPKPEDAGTKLCAYCDYKGACKQDG